MPANREVKPLPGWASDRRRRSLDNEGAENSEVKKARRRREGLIRHTDFIYTCVSHGRLQDTYELEKEIGLGSFGTIYLARQKFLGIYRAVKTVKKDPTNQEQLKELMGEVHAHMELDHPNVVKLIRYYDEGNVLYLVFELCQGPDLLTRINEAAESAEGRMGEVEAAAALRHMLKGLKCCHDRYIGHFDIKPENFMYMHPDLATLQMIDLGLSRGFTRDSFEIRGTTEYMAPEIWDGLYGPEADIWSCGVVLFTMLTGQPFLPLGASREEQRRLVKDRAWVRQRLRWAFQQGLPPQAHDLLVSMLRHDRHERPTVREALWHPFLKAFVWQDQYPKEIVNRAHEVLRTFPDDCRSFASHPVLKRAVLLVMAHIVAYSFNDTRPQRVAFLIVDKNSSGELSVEAVENYYEREYGDVPPHLQEAISGVDVDGDGYITFVEFLSATLPRSVRCNQQILRRVFDIIDRDGDGFITARDLAAAFRQGRLDDGVCQAALAEACAGNRRNHRISWEEFRALLMDTRSLYIRREDLDDE